MLASAIRNIKFVYCYTYANKLPDSIVKGSNIIILKLSLLINNIPSFVLFFQKEKKRSRDVLA